MTCGEKLSSGRVEREGSKLGCGYFCQGQKWLEMFNNLSQGSVRMTGN